ncbi:MAG: hypothetical protein MZV63_07175 [Marinilabiliales bacterium]|nr:hypothetical protein [Marinilabiliales bacterium]
MSTLRTRRRHEPPRFSGKTCWLLAVPLQRADAALYESAPWLDYERQAAAGFWTVNEENDPKAPASSTMPRSQPTDTTPSRGSSPSAETSH